MNVLLALIGGVLGLLLSPLLFLVVFIILSYLWLRMVGRRIKATVTRVEPADRGYRLFAQWQDPQTGHLYTFRTPIRNSAKYPVGSSIPVVFDPKKPTWHLIALFDTL